MKETSTILEEIKRPKKTFPNTLQRLAKHYWYSEQHGNIIEFADKLEKYTDIEVVCILNEKKQPVGIIQKEKLFISLSRRFGRELMSKNSVMDCCEKALVFPGQSNILYVQEEIREMESQNEYIVLVDLDGVYTGMLSFRDLSDYMVEMTNDDIVLASLLQERFIASTDKIETFNVEVDCWWTTAKGVGGDFYFIKKINENRFFASLCDVSGKGVSAALVVSMVWGFMSGHSMQKGLKDLLSKLNELIINSFQMEKYLTGIFMLYDSHKCRIYIADMGHAHSLFLRNGQVISMKKTQVNLPIGIEHDVNPIIYTIPIQSGDAILIYSDGIPEQDNFEGEEFGENRIVALTREALQMGKILSKILPNSIEEWRGNIPQRDDMTFIQFKF